MTTIPTWAAICAAVGTPLLAFFGVLAAQFIIRRGANELEVRSRREETLRVLRWAAELAMSEQPARVRLGLSQLFALGRSDLLDQAQQLFVDAALQAVVEDEPETDGSRQQPVPSGRDEGSANRD